MRPSEAPSPTPIAASPRKRRLDEAGHLREAADRLYGFQLPVGAYPIRESRYGVTLGLQTRMDRLAQFYSSRGYSVTKGRGGYTVEHTTRTAEGVGSTEKLRRVTLFLVKGERRMRELRFMITGPPDE